MLLRTVLMIGVAFSVPAFAQTTAENRMAPTTRPAPHRPTTKPAPVHRPVRPKPPTTKPTPLPQPVRPRPPVQPVRPRPPVQPVRPRPPANWQGQHWHHGSWLPPHTGWYDHWYGFGRIMLYADPNYGGRGLYLRNSVPNLDHYNFNDRTQSLHVSGRWLVCSDNNYRGHCRVVQGGMSHLYGIGMDRRINSVRYLGR